ncbi:YlmC/YmxH family sporulation protein [Natranaerofaba carboxydovora]|uniref:YlmC/YmxH family sporulation protein n=1 Tax=Natranaerofaba carboxydovora TaxID=2742683 RepID=UPI001F137C87|nr:YlmC/YmxH family sporulation protein [Natranaerofaba carboxydovora]UMZ73267.1 PRC-barrel domain protein [Natranaerofaba carboxydovora]
MITSSELKKREVINIQDGKRLGFVQDFDIDLYHGEIRALIVPGPNKLLGFFGKDKDYIIKWDDIVKIGSDVILVDLVITGERN